MDRQEYRENAASKMKCEQGNRGVRRRSARDGRTLLALCAAATMAGMTGHAMAASSTWTGGGSASWSDPLNWGGSVPGLTSGTTNADVATFNSGAAPLTVS